MTEPSNPWAQVRELYAQARQQAADQRETWLQAQAASPDVLDEVRSLLAHAPLGGADETGDACLAPPAAPWDETEGDRIGQRLGDWQITGRLGSGGMGVVYEARRADGSYEGLAAVKLLKRGMDSGVVLQRFAQERQALARLDHPHIARLLDAGLSADGLPYFVMEKIDGVAIDEAVRGLPMEQRLALFLQLADAVAYAHRKLLVHRDLKPGNVLVTLTGDVKLLDFGIAKALDPLDGSDGDTTLGGQRPYTPNYASPEQVRGEPVSIATDIYSLGVLLYQLLTGVRPTGRGATTPAEAARQVLDETPNRPSSLPQQSSDDPQWLTTRKRLKGDLDNILLKALEKPVERRYDSVDAMAADVRNFLSGYPVSAHAASWSYVATKFVSRNRLTVAAAALAGVSLVVGTAAATWSAHEAGLARDEARQRLADVRQVTHDLVFRFGDSVAYLPGGMNIKEDLLNDTLKQLERLAEASHNDPAILADVSALHARLAELQGNDTAPSTERPKQAKEHALQAIALGARVWPERKADRQFSNWLARAYHVKAQLERAEGHPELAIKTLDEAAPLIAESLALQTQDLDRAWLLGNQGADLLMQALLLASPNLPSMNQPDAALKRFDEAERANQALLDLGDKTLDALDATGRPEEPKVKASLLHALATGREGRALIWLRRDELAQARVQAQNAVDAQEKALLLDSNQVVWRDGVMAKNNTLSVVLLRLGDIPAAMAAAERAWQVASELAKSEGPDSRWVKIRPTLAQQYGRALAGVGRNTEAVPVLESSMAFWAAQAKASPNANALRRVGWTQTHLSRSLQALGRKVEALASAREAVQTLQSATTQFPPTRDVWLNLGDALAWLAPLEPANAKPLRDQARAAYDQAAALSPLKADHAAARAAVP